MRLSRPLLTLGLSLSCVAARAEDSALYMFSYTPSKEIDWRSPELALKTTIASQLKVLFKNQETYRSGIGHISIYYRCRRTDGRLRDVWTGLTGQNEKSVDKQDLFRDKIGLGILFKNYRDGQVQTPLGNIADHNANYQGRKEANAAGKSERLKPLFLRFPITAEQCDEVDDYQNFMLDLSWDGKSDLASYKRQSDRNVFLYGFNYTDPHLRYKAKLLDPSVKIGAGCTEFGASFVKMIGRFDPIFEKLWKKRLLVSEKLIGHLDPKTGRRHEVSLHDLLFTKLGNSWQHAGWSDRKLAFYDTEMMWDFLDGVRTCADIMDGHLRLSVPAKNCTKEIYSWVRKNRARLKTHQGFNIHANKIKINRRPIGRPSDNRYLEEKISYKEWVRIEGMTLN
jgi:hypothetical protein